MILIPEKKERTEEIDRILDKLRKSGYGSLTDAEKKSLFDASKKVNKARLGFCQWKKKYIRMQY